MPYVRMYALVVMDRICSYGVGDWWFWSPDTAEGVVSSSVSFFSPPSHFPFFSFPFFSFPSTCFLFSFSQSQFFTLGEQAICRHSELELDSSLLCGVEVFPTGDLKVRIIKASAKRVYFYPYAMNQLSSSSLGSNPLH